MAQPDPSAAREAFHRGDNLRAWELLGVHPLVRNGEERLRFSVWAPRAHTVSLLAACCGWRHGALPLTRLPDGIWELELPAADFAGANRAYQYAILGADGQWADKADPFAFAAELRPGTASLVQELRGYDWQDDAWMRWRAVQDFRSLPLNIYEVHAGSWQRREDGSFLSWDELGDRLIPYVRDMGYTHLELLPVTEHPMDASWGYQTSGYFAATSRHGTPLQLMRFIDRCHAAGLGVILDWVPAHFVRDAHGLRRFDGSACYEHPDPRRSDLTQWGTCLFDFSRGEVRSFLLSSACFWLECFHADGLRCVDVSAMLYPNFGRNPEEWMPGGAGESENPEAVRFLQQLNEHIRAAYPGVLTIAAEVTARPGVTAPAAQGGLGFSLKWNQGWAADTLRYFSQDYASRRWHDDKLSFPLIYAFSERYVLPLSHEEVARGRRSLLEQQPGDLRRKLAGLRSCYAFAMAYPGRKLLFMGCEFGHFAAWDGTRAPDWYLLTDERHAALQRFVRTLNRLYRTLPALYALDDGRESFRRIACDSAERGVIAFLRTDGAGQELLCAYNFTTAVYPTYPLSLPAPGTLTELLNTDSVEFGGSDCGNPWPVEVAQAPAPDAPCPVHVVLPPLSAVWFLYDRVHDGNPAERPFA